MSETDSPDATAPTTGGLAARRPLGQLSVSSLCLGGNVFGWTADEAASFDVLDAYTAAGGNFIDTADVYSGRRQGVDGGMDSETVIGNWTAARGNRDDLVIATKVGAHPDRKGLSAANIKAAADDSLRRLRTDRIDLYYTHFDDESVEVSEIVSALDDLVRAGKVREIGASNISPERLEASLDFSDGAGAARYAALQPHYNLVSRDTFEGPLAELAERRQLAVMPYFALAMGFLTGKYRADDGGSAGSAGTAGTGGSPRAERASKYLETERGRRVLAALDRIAEARGIAHATIAVAWLLTRPTVTSPIASARSTGQLAPLLALDEVRLTEEETKLLTDASE
ncbi:aldo/keto reductase [Streptomyces sp. WMMB 322]|uniref:aldo/keto reductase n=1 Tax=Streptomyces sp. WMMB 322 TaxID=1286821 RepID=UPI0006E3AF67|nr:aldo/keto reductase [Streptomyces sp. WMMB 322]SCK39127.1 Predicted oxidoreductase [Streptomyces sp. WMMB 322]